MKILKTVAQARLYTESLRREGKSLGLVPTMGFLHVGHMSLVSACREDNDASCVSIFVNPIQFGPNEDFSSYPRNFERDVALLEDAQVDAVFCPDSSEMYTQGFATAVSVKGLSDCLCGASRPGHFDGVCTVVSKLFGIIRPDNAYFGEKDYQQLLIIRRMVADLNLPLSIHGVPIVREKDGLALSSRNVYLSEVARKSALSLSRSFELIEKNRHKSPHEVISAVKTFIETHPLTEVDYIEFRDGETLETVEGLGAPFRAFIAVRVDGTRLIDNKRFV